MRTPPLRKTTLHDVMGANPEVFRVLLLSMALMVLAPVGAFYATRGMARGGALGADWAADRNACDLLAVVVSMVVVQLVIASYVAYAFLFDRTDEAERAAAKRD